MCRCTRRRRRRRRRLRRRRCRWWSCRLCRCRRRRRRKKRRWRYRRNICGRKRWRLMTTETTLYCPPQPQVWNEDSDYYKCNETQ